MQVFKNQICTILAIVCVAGPTMFAGGYVTAGLVRQGPKQGQREQEVQKDKIDEAILDASFGAVVFQSTHYQVRAKRDNQGEVAAVTVAINDHRGSRAVELRMDSRLGEPVLDLYPIEGSQPFSIITDYGIDGVWDLRSMLERTDQPAGLEVNIGGTWEMVKIETIRGGEIVLEGDRVLKWNGDLSSFSDGDAGR